MFGSPNISKKDRERGEKMPKTASSHEDRISVLPAIIKRQGRVLDTDYVYVDDQGRFYCPFCKNSRLRARRNSKHRGGQSRRLTCVTCGCLAIPRHHVAGVDVLAVSNEALFTINPETAVGSY